MLCNFATKKAISMTYSPKFKCSEQDKVNVFKLPKDMNQVQI